MRTDFMYFCIKSSIGTRVKLASCKSALNTVVYSTDLSKVVGPVLVLFFIALLFVLRDDLFYVFVLVWICRCPLPLGVWGVLRFVIVALPGLFSHLF